MDFDFLNKDAKNNKISKKDCFTTITSKSSQNFDVVANDKYSKTKNSSQSPLTPMSMNFLGSPKEEINDKKVVFLIKKQYIETLNCNICKIEFGFKLLASWKRKHWYFFYYTIF